MIGEQLGAWVIERRLGEGGMGTVYVARHSVMGRRAAIKVLRPEHGTKPEMVQRFLNEARAAAAIEHPGIVEVIDVGERDDGSAFLVMELLDGEPLSARLKARGRLPAETAVRLTRQIAAALGAAHARGIVHRDLKPDNVLVVPDPETTAGERVKLLDFGIAKLHGDLAADAPATRTGAIFGTPMYMSPEQCRGGVDVDHRADLYALGCMLYEMVCGRTPFRAPGLGELLSKHMSEAPMPPRQLTPELPAQLEDVILRLLAKDPDERFQSTRDLVAALDGKALDDSKAPSAELATMATISPVAETVATTMGGAASEVVEPSRPRRWPIYVGAFVSLAVGAAIVVAIIGTRRAKQFSLADPTPDTRRFSYDDAAPRSKPTLGLAFLGDLETASGSAFSDYGAPGAWEAAGQDFALAIRDDADAPARWRAAVPACAGYAAVLRDQPTAEASLREAATIDPKWALPHLGLANLLAGRGDRDGALAAAHEAQRLAQTWWLPVVAEARVHRQLDELDDAIEHYQRALRMAPGEPVVLSELALVFHAQHLDTEAIRLAKDALAKDPDMISARLLLAERALEAGDYKTARAEADRAVANDPRSASAQLARADALAHLHDDEQARVAYQRVLALEDETHQASVDPARLAAIKKALDAGKLPIARSPRSHKGRSHQPDEHPVRSHQGGDNPIDDGY